MAKFEIVNNGVAMLSFNELVKPEPSKDRGGYVTWGKKDQFVNELIRYYDEHAEHGAIVGAKAKYLWGKGLEAKDKTKQIYVDSFKDTFSKVCSLNAFGEKFALDAEMFNDVFIQVISDLYGKPKEYLHLQRANCRLSPCGKKLFYCEDFSNLYDNELKTITEYRPGIAGSSFLRFRYYQPAKNKLAALYPLPSYKGCLQEIKSDIDITTFDSNYVLNGFSAGTLITFFNGEPEMDQKRDIRNRFTNMHAGPDEAGSIIINYAEKDGKAAEATALNVDDLDKKFTTIQQRYQQKIMTGHNVVNPELFGIKTEGQLGNRVSLKESHELFINTYTKPRQTSMLLFFETLIFLKTGQWIELVVDQLDPIGYDLLSPEAIAVQSPDEIRETLGLEPLTNPTLDSAGKPIQIQQDASAVNDHLKNLTGKQMQQMNRIAKQFRDGKITQPQAAMQLKNGFGLSDADANDWLGIDNTPTTLPTKMSSQVSDFLIAQFEAIDTASDLELELLSEEEVHIHKASDAMRYEVAMQMKFSDDAPSFIDGLIGTIKNLLPGSNKKQNDTTTTEIITKYKYALKADAEPAKSGSRPFCVKMMALADSGKEYTYDQIDAVRLAGLKNGFPEVDNIWDFRGGFYTHPGTTETDPFCRHIWKAITYKVKKKS